jgi:dihydrolipoamide dehydrogenase
MQNYDVVVIGAGPGGYIAAIRAAQLGFRVACVEGNAYDDPQQEPRLGGTCLNVGCIPSKALLASSEHFESMQHANIHGISMDNLQINPETMVKRKDQIVDKMTKGIEFLFKKNKVTLIKGYAAFAGKQDSNYHLKVTNVKTNEVVDVLGTHIIIATGSKARHLPNVTVDQHLICDNEGALNFNAVPKKLAVIGAGVIGLELGSVWRRLGAEVDVLEASPTFLGACDAALSKEALKLFTKQGLKFSFGVKINQVKTENDQVHIQYHADNGEEKTIVADRLIVSIGRVPNTDNLNLEAIGLKTDERGFIQVNHDNQTALANVWAIGDVVPGPMLAHKAEDEGVAVAERIAGQKPHIDFNCVPWVIYTAPEIAWVGQNEQQLKAAGIAYKQGQFPFMANGRALGMANSDGFIKVLACEKTDQILGVHIIGHNASDLIAEAVVAMEFKAASEDIARVCHPHPSLSEVMREACLAVDGRALNM